MVSGMSAEEIAKLNLAGMKDEEVQEVLRRKLIGKTNNGHPQKVISVGELEEYLQKGWEYVNTLPNDKAIVRFPDSGAGAR